MKILIFNGINTDFGGSGLNSLNLWMSSFKEKKIAIEIRNSVPKVEINIVRNIYLFIYFLPGSIFRILPFFFSEYLIKLSFTHFFF